MENPEYKITKELAVAELKDIIEYYSAEDIDEESVEKNYNHAVKAVMLGLLTFDEDRVPSYQLKEAIKSESGIEMLSHIDFITRITIQEKKRLVKGLDTRKDGFELGIRCFAYVIKQPANMLDKFGRFDYKVIEQMAGLFM